MLASGNARLLLSKSEEPEEIEVAPALDLVVPVAECSENLEKEPPLEGGG